MSGRASHPSAHNRSLAEGALIDTMDHVIAVGQTNERQLAQLCKDLIQLTGDQDIVKDYINRKAIEALDEAQPWR